MNKFRLGLKQSVILFVPFLLALASGDLVPDFSIKNQEGKVIHLSDYRGKFVLIYFYPKDDTPGCTKEACTIRDEFAQFKKANAVVFGVSTQNEQSHQAFKSKHHLPFDLLVDTDGSLAKTLGISKFPVIGLTRRQSILIGPDSHVIHFYSDVDPEKHAQEVLADIQKFSQKSNQKDSEGSK